MNEQYNISFIKNFGHNQMCVEPISIEDTLINHSIYTMDYRIKMICNNSINGLLNTHVQHINGNPNFYYDISGLQSLSITLENTPLDYGLLSRIIYEIYNLLFTCEKYMLDTDKILLEPEYIFMTQNNSAINFCYLPFKDTDFTSSMRKLFDFFLRHIDHTDEKCVYTAYSIHKHCVANNVTPTTLISYINKDDVKNNNNPPFNAENNKMNNSITSSSTEKTSSTISLDDHFHNNSQINISNSKPLITNVSSNATIECCILTIGIFIGLIIILALYFIKLIDVPLLLTLLLILIGTGFITGYNIFKKIEGPLQISNQIEPIYENNTTFYPEDSGGTILLSSIENNDSHMLISTGSDINSQVILSNYPFTIGKSSNCDLVLQNPIISRLHCRINCCIDDNNSTIYYLEDLNSTNGTFINKTPITPYQKYNLKTGDNISFGHLTYIFR